MNENMGTIVMSSYDVDCDGWGESFKRIELPKYVIAILHERQDKLAFWREQLEALRSIDCVMNAIENNTIDSLHKQIEQAERNISTQAPELRGIEAVVHACIEFTDQGMGMGDWHPMHLDDEMRMHDELEEEGGFNWDYWQEEGYYSYFNAR